MLKIYIHHFTYWVTAIWARDIFHILLSKKVDHRHVNWQSYTQIHLYSQLEIQDQIEICGVPNAVFFFKSIHDSTLKLCHEKISFSPLVLHPYPSHCQFTTDVHLT